MAGLYSSLSISNDLNYENDPIAELQKKLSGIGLNVRGGDNLALANAGTGDRVYDAGSFEKVGHGVNLGKPNNTPEFKIPELVKISPSLDPQGIFNGSGGMVAAATPDYSEIDPYVETSSPKAPKTADISSMLRYGRGTTAEVPNLKFDGSSFAEGLGNGINNYIQMRNYGQRRELDMADRKMVRDIIAAQRESGTQEAAQKRQRELDIYHRNYDSALSDPAYGETPEDRKRNALLDAANDWAYMKKVQEGRATTYTQNQQAAGKDQAKLQSFSKRRAEFKNEYGFDPFNDGDMKGRKFSSAQINGFRQYFSGSEFADELSIMERNTKSEQAQTNLAGSKARNEQTQVRTQRLRETPIPQPGQRGSGKPSTSKSAQVQQMHENGEISDEEYKQWLLGKKGPSKIPRGSGFGGRAGSSPSPVSKPKAGSRVDSFSARYGF